MVTQDHTGRAVAWSALEPIATRVARVYAGTSENPYHLRQGDAWALAWHHVGAVIPDATVSELSPWIGIVGEPFWLSTVVCGIAARRGVDATAWVNTARTITVYEAP